MASDQELVARIRRDYCGFYCLVADRIEALLKESAMRALKKHRGSLTKESGQAQRIGVR